jgi:signal transduction histidine kinase
VTEKQSKDEFSVDDERALQVLATQAGVAVENARLYEEMIRAQDEGIAVRIEGAVGDIDAAIRDLRNYIFGLRPGILADRQLDQALRELGAEFEQRSGVVTAVDVDPGVASELASIASDVVQFTREALSNVGRLADATTCRVTLRRGGGGGRS